MCFVPSLKQAGPPRGSGFGHALLALAETQKEALNGGPGLELGYSETLPLDVVGGVQLFKGGLQLLKIGGKYMLGRSAAETGGRTAAKVAPKGLLHENPSALVKGRVGELTSAIPDGAKGRITMGVAVAEDANGVRSVLVATSEPRGYLRLGVSLNPSETMVSGLGHAEADLIAYAKANNLKIIDIGATRPVCVPCQDLIGPTGSNISTPLKRRPQ